MALSTTQIQQLYTAYLNRPVDAAGLEYWKEQNVSMADLRANLANDAQPEYVELYGDRTRAELVEAIYQNMFGRSAEPAGIEYWVNGEGSTVPASQLQQLFIEAASAADRLTFNERVAEDEGEIDISGPEGETFTLTDGRDSETGTDGNDTFIGLVGQNQDGSVANALATGDYIDGGAGRDKIEATLISDGTVDDGITLEVSPRTVNVEEVYIEALDTVTVDAGRMDAVEQFWTDNSRDTMTFDDVRLGTGQSITKDITFGMRSVDTDAGLNAWFDTNSLRNAAPSQTNSQLEIRIADVSTETPTTPLANVEVNLSFNIGEETVTLEGVRSTDGTYAGLVEGIQNALAQEGYGSLNVSLSDPYNQVTFAGNTVNLPFTAQEILVTDPNGSAFSNVNFTQAAIAPVQDGFLVAGNAQPVDPNTVSTLIETNLVLDNAGRGSVAGDVTIGGMSNSGRVIEKLNLIVDRNSKIDDLMTGSGRVATKGFEVIEVTSAEAQGDVSIANVGNVYNFDSTAFTGENLSVKGQAGFTTDQSANSDSSEFAIAQDHVYNTSASNDTITVQWDGDKAGEFANFSLAVNSGAGNDTVTLQSQFIETGSNNLLDQQNLLNVSVNTGAGNDTIWTEGAGAVNIAAGAGDDVVYTDNSGSQWISEDAGAATWVVGTTNTAINDLRGVDSVALTSGAGGNGSGAVLLGAELRVTFSGADTGGAVTSALAAAFDNGFENTVKIFENDEEVFGDRTDINAAIKRAINEDATLNKLLLVSDGPNNSLVIRSKIDGSFVAEDLEIEILTAQSTTATGARYLNDAATQRIEEAIQESTNNSAYTYADTVLADSAASANGIAGIATETLATTAGAAETFDANFAGSTAAAGETITFDGVTVTYAGAPADATALATEFVNQYNAGAGNYTATDNLNGTVSFTANTNGDQPDVVNGDFGGTSAPTVVVSNTVNGVAGSGADLTGTASTADNTGNVVDLGAGNDLVVLSTNAVSNETLEFTGYSNGQNTIVNFDSDAASTGADQLDFTAYLTTLESTSGSTVSQSTVAIGVGTGGALEANNVSVVDFVSATDESFTGITSANLLAALNGTGTVDYGDLGASTSLTAIPDFAAGTGFVGDSYKAVLMIENDANDGEYQAWEVTVGQDAAGTTGTAVATGAQLIGTYDFGNELTGLTDASLVA